MVILIHFNLEPFKRATYVGSFGQVFWASLCRETQSEVSSWITKIKQLKQTVLTALPAYSFPCTPPPLPIIKLSFGSTQRFDNKVLLWKKKQINTRRKNLAFQPGLLWFTEQAKKHVLARWGWGASRSKQPRIRSFVGVKLPWKMVTVVMVNRSDSH